MVKRRPFASQEERLIGNPDLGLPSPQNYEKLICVVEAAKSVVFCYSSLS